MEPPGLGARPGVERADELAAFVRVGAGRLRRADVADVGARAVAGDAAFVVELVQVQVLALRALPGVEVGMEAEAAVR